MTSIASCETDNLLELYPHNLVQNGGHIEHVTRDML